MATLNQQIQRAKNLSPRKIEDALFTFLKSISEELADRNVNRIYNFGEDVFGSVIGIYSHGTEAISKGRKKAGDRFDLKDTGEFLEKLYAKVEGGVVSFGTSDSKKDDVFENLLSRDIFGLNDEDLQKVIQEDIKPFFISYFKENLA